MRPSLVDLSGSMCTAYSSLGSHQKNEDMNARLLVIYIVYQFKGKTPIVIHENVLGFVTNEICDLAEQHGYDHFTIRCRPTDVGISVGRPRRWVAPSKAFGICVDRGFVFDGLKLYTYLMRQLQ